MNNDAKNSQRSLTETFVAESAELLSESTNLILDLGSTSTPIKAINGLFRNFHSIKGNAAMFGLEHVKRLAHDLESLLGELRQHPKWVGADIVALLMDCRDYLADSVVKEVTGALSEAAVTLSFELSEKLNGMIESLRNKVETNLHHIVDRLANTVSNESPDVQRLVEELRRALEGTEAHEHEDVDDARAPRTTWPQPYRDLMNLVHYTVDEEVLSGEQRESIGTFLDQLLGFSQSDDMTLAIKDIQERVTAIMELEDSDALVGEVLEESLSALDHEQLWLEPPEETPVSSDYATDTTVTRTMRVPESEIDQFLSYVGELIVVSDMFKNIQERMGTGGDPKTLIQSFRIANDTFVSLSDDLQSSIMSLRRVPLDSLFQKAPRIIYGVQTESNREVDLRMEGDSLLIDKSLLEALDAPFTHLIRNAADHGIEAKQAREEKGKTPTGIIQLRAWEEDAYIAIAVEDDGEGLNTESIRKKADAMNLLPKGKELSDDEVHDYIFYPGLSTAKTVSDVSGRGVGLDSVRTEVEEMGGTVEVNSRKGKGTCFTLMLPKTITTRIIDGFLVQVGDYLIILPMRQVLETFSFKDDELVSLVGREHCIQRNDEVLPVHDLGRFLGMPNRSGKVSEESVLVQVMLKNGTVALQVDRVMGVQKFVLRSIGGVQGIDFIAGGALMGDGSVAFVLDLKAFENRVIN